MRQGRQRVLEIVDATADSLFGGSRGDRSHLFDRDEPALADVVDRGIARDAENPGEEGNLTLLVGADHANKLGEHLLRDVLGLVVIVDDAAHIAVDVVGVTRVEKRQRLAITELRALDCLGDVPGRSRTVLAPLAAARNALVRLTPDHCCTCHMSSPDATCLPCQCQEAGSDLV